MKSFRKILFFLGVTEKIVNERGMDLSLKYWISEGVRFKFLIAMGLL